MKESIALVGIVTMLALTLVMFIVFTSAYISPAKAVRVNVDNYGEAQFEMILLSVLLPLNIFSTIYVSRRLTSQPAQKDDSFVIADRLSWQKELDLE